METKYDVTITAIGGMAKTFLQDNNSAILIDEGIRPNLSDMVVEHTPGDLKEDIKVGDRLTIAGAKFVVERVGDAVNNNLRDEGHCTLVFNAEGSMPGQIVLKGSHLPVISVGAKIFFYKGTKSRSKQ